MTVRNQQGYTLIEVMIAGLILAVVLIPLLNMYIKVINLANSTDSYNKALYLAQGKLEELKAVSFDQVEELQQGGTTFNFSEVSDYNYQIEIEDENYGLKKITVTVFYHEFGREKSLQLTAERRNNEW